MRYKNELIRSMRYLAKKKNTIFLGQSVMYSGNAIYNTLVDVPKKKKLKHQYLKTLKWVCLSD